jgi:aldose 1-epimerase
MAASIDPDSIAIVNSPVPVSGAQYAIAHGGYRATIASVGASLRELTFEGRDLVVPFDAGELRPNYRGATLAPWPNRVTDGRYEFGGDAFQLALTEPARGHALHGLASWLDFSLVSSADDSVTLEATIEPQAGYPWRVLVSVTNTLTDDGLATTVTATNLSDSAAPFGTGPHPYLVAGPGRVDDWTLELPAAPVLQVTPDRLVPTEQLDVDAVDFDWRTPRPIGDTFVDHAFTDLSPDAKGVTTVRLLSGETGVEMSWGPECPWVQIHTADQPDPERSRLGLAVEPMTCPPDAFNSGTDLIMLGVDGSTSASWVIRAI